MYLEYDWTFGVYRPRIGQVMTSFRGYAHFVSLKEARYVLGLAACKLGRKTASRTWEIVPKAEIAD